MSARALPCWRVARRPKASGWNTPMSLSAMFLCRLVFNKSESSLPLWRTFVHEYNSFNNCDLPVPLSPTMTLIVGRKVNSYLLLNGQKLETDSFSMACVLMRKLYVPVSDKWSSAYGCSFCMATIWLRAVSSITLDSLVLQFGRFGRLTARESIRNRIPFKRPTFDSLRASERNCMFLTCEQHFSACSLAIATVLITLIIESTRSRLMKIIRRHPQLSDERTGN